MATGPGAGEVGDAETAGLPGGGCEALVGSVGEFVGDAVDDPPQAARASRANSPSDALIAAERRFDCG